MRQPHGMCWLRHDVARALGFTDAEMEVAEGLPAGRISELGL